MSAFYPWCLLLLPVAVLLAMLYMPRTFYESRNPYLRGEDYWLPFRPHEGPVYSRGPRPWRRMRKVFHSREVYRRSDAGLEEAARGRLKEQGLPWRDVVVRAKAGELRLYGLVPSAEEKRAVEEAAAACEGARGLVSFLRVHDSSAPWREGGGGHAS